MLKPRPRNKTRCRLVAFGALGLCCGSVYAQGQAPQAAQAQPSPRAVAPFDPTGYWAAVITEDWTYRMMTPPKGDYASVPLNANGKAAADQWDQAKDIAAGEQCRAFGAAGIIRMPTRLHITWQDDRTLKLEFDSGTQTRLLPFDKPAQPPAQATWQGSSVASWETVQEGEGIMRVGGGAGGNAAGLGGAGGFGGGGAGGAGGFGASTPSGAGLSGSLRAVTTNMRPGYLRRNGVPYSGNTVLTEFFDRTDETNGDVWLVVTSIITDPQYLTEPFILTTHFKRESDGSKFSPRPCDVTPPVVGKVAPR